MLKRIAVVAVMVIAGCSAMRGGLGADLTAWINDSIAKMSFNGCAQIKPAGQAKARDVVDSLMPIATTDPAAVIAALESAADQAPVAWLWSAIHKVLDPIKSLSQSQWTKFAQGAAAAGLAGCSGGIGASPPVA